MAYFIPILARGKSNQRTATAVIAAGATSIALDNTAGDYVVGSHVFVSKSDSTEYEYLGPVVSATTTAIVVTLAVAVAKGANALVWKPTSSCRTTGGPGIYVAPWVEWGVFTRASRGGRIVATKTADTLRRWELVWDRRSPVDWELIRAYLADHCGGTLLPFSLGWYDTAGETTRVSKCWVVAPFGTERESNLLSAKIEDSDKWTWVIPVVIDDLDSYVT